MFEIKHLRWVFIGLLPLLGFVSIMAPPQTVGISAQWSGSEYHFAGGTAPWALAFAALVMLLYFLLMNSTPAKAEKPLPGVFRRWVALWIDFVLAIMVFAPVVGLLISLREWRRTGVFEWAFERDSPASGDGSLATLGLLLDFAALAFYFTLPLVRRRPSPGACIAGYQVIPDGDAALSWEMAALRTLLGFVAAATFYLAPFVARDRGKGKFWLDRVFGTRAVKLQ